MAPAPRPTHVATSVRPELAASRPQVVARVLLPRGREQVYKWMLIPVGALLAVAVRADPPSPAEVWQLVVLWFVTEQLGYQARYQLNDLRDRATDAAHPAGAARGRLSFPWTPARAAAVWGSIVARAVLAVLAVRFVLDGRFAQAAGWFLVLMVITSAAYELARERVRRERVVPGSARAVSLGVPVLLCIPLGYGLRIWAGYHALSPDRALTGGGPWPEVLLVVTALALYAASTLLAWTLEGTSFLRGPGAAADPALGDRAHIALLVAHAGLLERGAGGLAPGAAGAARGPVAPTQLVVARDRPAPRGARPVVWDVCAAVALLCSYSFVALSVDEPVLRGALLVAGAVTAAAPLVARRVRRPGPGAWDARPSWLGSGALSLVVGIELAALAVLLLVEVVLEPEALLVSWFTAFVLFAWASIRASSYTRGFGPLSLVRRPVQWWRARSRPTDLGVL